MVYATETDYTAWLQGRTPAVPLAEFGFWASRASEEIDFLTFNRLCDANTLAANETVVKKTTIALAEIIFGDESPNAEKSLKSRSIGSYSESFDDKGDESTPQSRISLAIRRGLGLTGLLFRGRL